MINKIINYSGVLRITNEKTLNMWKQTGKYDELINQGFIYNSGCGRFRESKCECCKCKKHGK